MVLIGCVHVLHAWNCSAGLVELGRGASAAGSGCVIVCDARTRQTLRLALNSDEWRCKRMWRRFAMQGRVCMLCRRHNNCRQSSGMSRYGGRAEGVQYRQCVLLLWCCGLYTIVVVYCIAYMLQCCWPLGRLSAHIYGHRSTSSQRPNIHQQGPLAFHVVPIVLFHVLQPGPDLINLASRKEPCLDPIHSTTSYT